MIDARRQALLQALWPEGRIPRLGVWAIMDCARDPKIYLALLESNAALAAAVAVELRE